MNWTELVKRVRWVLFKSHPIQSVIREGVRKGFLPRAFYVHVPIAGPEPFITPQGNTVTFIGYEQRGFAWELVSPAGKWEATSLRVFSEIAQTSRMVLDVGAFIGIYTLVAAADSSANVIAFEPNQKILPSLRRNINENGSLSELESSKPPPQTTVDTHSLQFRRTTGPWPRSPTIKEM